MDEVKIKEMFDFLAKTNDFDVNSVIFKETTEIIKKCLKEISLHFEKNNYLMFDLKDITWIFILPLTVLYINAENSEREKIMETIKKLPNILVIFALENNIKLNKQEEEMLENINDFLVSAIKENKDISIN